MFGFRVSGIYLYSLSPNADASSEENLHYNYITANTKMNKHFTPSPLKSTSQTESSTSLDLSDSSEVCFLERRCSLSDILDLPPGLIEKTTSEQTKVRPSSN